MSGISQSVQFASIDEVLGAYMNRQVPAWSIWQKTQFMFKYEGRDIEQGAAMLQKHLQVLSRSAAIYTLKVYEDLPKTAKIKSNTPDDGSFNFRFVDSPYSTNGYNGGNNALLQEIAELKLQIAALQEQGEDDTDDSLGMLGKIMEMPGIGEAVAGLLPVVIGKILGAPVAPQAQALAGVPGKMSLKDALQILKEKDPLFEDHMIKLATLAQNNPAQFTHVISMIRFI